MSKAADGRSTIIQRSDGWHGFVSFGTDPATGKRRRKHVRGRTKSEVAAKVAQLELVGSRVDLTSGTYLRIGPRQVFNTITGHLFLSFSLHPTNCGFIPLGAAIPTLAERAATALSAGENTILGDENTYSLMASNFS